MRKQVQAFIQSAAEAFELRGPVYEFGHCPAEEMADRPAAVDGFPGAGCLGSEALEEAEVERLSNLERLPYADGSACTVVCIDALEHLVEPSLALEEMIRILTPGGMLLICASSEGEAGKLGGDIPLTPQSLQQMLASLAATLVGWQGPDELPHTLLAVGCKAPLPDSLLSGLNRFIQRLSNRLTSPGVSTGWRGCLHRLLPSWFPDRWQPPSTVDPGEPQFLLHLPLDRNLKHRLL